MDGAAQLKSTASVDGAAPCHIEAHFGGIYMVYNLLAALSVARLMGVGADVFQQALNAYHPENGRLQHFEVDGREVVLNLAKNPTGFNQNISLLLADERPKSLMLVINDDFNDGKDISWIWDMDLERLAADPTHDVLCGDIHANELEMLCSDTRANELEVLCSGTRANDVQVRCKYAGLTAHVVSSVEQALSLLKDRPQDWPLYVLCNYSALWPAQAELKRLGVSL